MTIQVITNDPVIAEPLEEKKPELIEKSTEQKEQAKSEVVESEDKKEDVSEDESGNEPEESNESEKDKPKKKGGFQKRIDKLSAQKAEALQQAEYWKNLATQSKAGEPVKTEEVKKVDSNGKPNPDNYETHLEFVEALTDWKIEQKEIKDKELSAKSNAESEYKKAMNEHFEREKSFAENTKDYQNVVQELMDSDPVVSPVFENLIISSKKGSEILYNLAKNPEEFERINSLHPSDIYKEFGVLEYKLSLASNDSKKLEINKITKAPSPITPVGSGSKGSAVKSIYDEDVSQKEYERLRMEQIKKRNS